MKPRLTLFHVDGEKGLRGGERQLLYLACRMRELGHGNVVVCRRASPLDREAALLDLDRAHLPFAGEWDPFSAWSLRRLALAAENPILHAHTAHAAAAARFATLGTRLPWVVHRRVDFRLSGGLSRRLKYESAGRIVAVSESVRRILAEDGIPEGSVRVVHDCVPVGAEEARTAGLQEPYVPPSAAERQARRAELAAEWGFSAGVPWIGNAAALVPHKDHETLLRAAALVLQERGDARLVILGEGPERPPLETLAGSLGIRESVRFAGWRPDIAACLKSFDLLAHSSWGEGMGSVLLEAMACGLPIAASSAGGIPEVVEDGRTGLLVPPRDPRRLADAILRTLSDPAGTARRSAAALEAVKAFNLAAAGEKMENLYLELAAR
jgi:glycosyltransferase involved in cell wall biosynthesis